MQNCIRLLTRIVVDGEAAADVLKVLVATAGRRQLLSEGPITGDVPKSSGF